jgi:hypothetical protein
MLIWFLMNLGFAGGQVQPAAVDVPGHRTGDGITTGSRVRNASIVDGTGLRAGTIVSSGGRGGTIVDALADLEGA